MLMYIFFIFFLQTELCKKEVLLAAVLLFLFYSFVSLGLFGKMSYFMYFSFKPPLPEVANFSRNVSHLARSTLMSVV